MTTPHTATVLCKACNTYHLDHRPEIVILSGMIDWTDERETLREEVERLRAENLRLTAVADAAKDTIAEFRGEPVDELGLAVRLTRLGRAIDKLDRSGLGTDKAS